MDEKQKKVLLDEISRMCDVPESGDFFVEKLREFQLRFKDILQRDAGKNSPELPQAPADSVIGDDKSYFFEINRGENLVAEDPCQWENGNFQMGDREDLLSAIRERFIPKINDFPVAPSLFQTETIRCNQPGMALEINFMKSEARLVGFAREVRKMESFTESRSGNVIKVSTAFQNVDRDEMNQRIIQLMEDDADAREAIYLYYYMYLKPGKSKN